MRAVLWSFRIFMGRDHYRRPLTTYDSEYWHDDRRVKLHFGEIPSEVIAAWRARRETFQRYMGVQDPDEAELPEQWTSNEVFTTVQARLAVEVREIESHHPLAGDFFWYSFADMRRIREEIAGRIPDALDDGRRPLTGISDPRSCTARPRGREVSSLRPKDGRSAR